MAPSLDAVIQAAIQLGEQLPDTWKRTFRSLAPPDDGWMTVQQYEEERNAIRRLFFTVREAMDGARRAAEAHQARRGSAPADLPRLLTLIDDARRLEEEVFRDWPSFADPLPPPDLSKALPVDEAFAEILGLSVEQVQKLAEHRGVALEEASQ